MSVSTIAAFDCADDTLSVALNLNGAITCHRSDKNTPHSRIALPMLTALLETQRLTTAMCDAFAFAAGPGKFSALRLICAIAKTLAYIHNKPLIAVPSLAALAATNTKDKSLITKIRCAIPAHREHVYFAVCRKQNNIWHCPQPSIVHADHTPPPNASTVKNACGDGFVRYPHLLANGNLHSAAAYSDAETIATLAATMLTAGETVPPLSCEPIYARKKVALTIAERNRLNKQQKNP